MKQTTRLQDLAETFEMLASWEERYAYLIEIGRALEPLTPAEHDEAHKVRGCMSQVWLVGDGLAADGTLHFRGDSDAHIVRGLIAVVMALFNDRRPDEILAEDVRAAFEQLGLESHISMNRRNGFYAMVERIREMALRARGRVV